MDLLAISRRVAETLRRDADLMERVAAVEWGAAPRATYGDRFPLVRVSPSLAGVARRQAMGTGTSPDRHGPQLTQGGVEAVIVGDTHAFTADAQAEAWGIVPYVEAALARNARLADADGGDRLVNGIEMGAVTRLAERAGKEREVVTVMLTARLIEDLVLNTPEAEAQ